jgi:hypothetical protein
MFLCIPPQQTANMGNGQSRKSQKSRKLLKLFSNTTVAEDNALEHEFAQNFINWLLAQNTINEMPIVNYNHYFVNMIKPDEMPYFGENGKYLGIHSLGNHFLYNVDGGEVTITFNEYVANAFLRSCGKIAIKYGLPVTLPREDVKKYNLCFPCPNLNAIVKKEIGNKIQYFQQYTPENIQQMKDEVCNIKNVINQRTQQLKDGLPLSCVEMQNFIDTTMALNVRVVELNNIISQGEKLDYDVMQKLAVLQSCVKLLYIPCDNGNDGDAKPHQNGLLRLPDVPVAIPIKYPTASTDEIVVIATVETTAIAIPHQDGLFHSPQTI